MTTIVPDGHGPVVLVHGAWVGEWSWAPIVPALEAAGCAAHAVSLRGHGARWAESSPRVTLGDHVDDVVAAIESSALTDVILVAHSYGGRVITAAWPRLAGRVARMVYVDAHAPVGEPPGAPPSFPAAMHGLLPIDAFFPDPAALGGDRATAAFYRGLMPQSIATLTEPWFHRLPAGVDKLYVAARDEQSPRFRSYAAAAQADPAWRYVEVPGSHWLVFEHPAEVAAAILSR